MGFGIDIPRTVKEAVSIDESNGNTLWKYSIKTEINNSRVAFNSSYARKERKILLVIPKLLAIKYFI